MADRTDLSWVYELAGGMGLPLGDVLALTYPELLLVVKGYRRRHGMDAPENKRAITANRLKELMDGYPDKPKTRRSRP